MKFILFIFVGIIYEKYYRDKKCRTKIYEYINNLGGTIVQIEKVTSRDEIYNVDYKIGDNNELLDKTVKFNFWYEETWY